MSIGLFIAGTLAFMIVLAAAGLLAWGAVLDGRYAHKQADIADLERKRAEKEHAA